MTMPRYTRKKVREAQLAIAHMICDLIRSGFPTEAGEAIRQGQKVGVNLGPYPENGAASDAEHEAFANLFQELH